MNSKKRSSVNEMKGVGPSMPGGTPGVGGRQAGSPPLAGGGGYLDECNQSEPRLGALQKSRAAANDDPRMEDLRAIGLSRRWLQVAEITGFDMFMEIWKTLDADNITCHPSERMPEKMVVPYFTRYMVYQRNQYIRSLASQGQKPGQIRKILISELCERLSVRHITRIMKEVRIKV